MTAYVHGYDPRESLRLQDQATTLAELLHADTAYPAGHTVLEAGCGVGAQTVLLARNSPSARITSIDVSETSLEETRKAVAAARLGNVTLRRADVFDLPFAPASFDHVFVCFVLEHLARPVDALRALKQVIRPGGTITLIEGDHGSTFFHPDSEYARRAIRCQIELQAKAGGDSLIGRAVYPLLREAGFSQIRVSPRMVYADASRPELVEGFTKKTFTAMIEGVRAPAIAAGLIGAADFDRGVADLYRTADADGVFCYTFFKGAAVNGTIGERDEQPDSPRGNAMMVIRPYRFEGIWVFDDAAAGLVQEPFVAGVPEMIDLLVRDIPNAASGFRLLFSAGPFPGYQKKVTWLRGESGGNYYQLDDPPMEGWLCPALFRYFAEPPKELFVKAEAIE